jgi:hypothetical protein
MASMSTLQHQNWYTEVQSDWQIIGSNGSLAIPTKKCIEKSHRMTNPPFVTAEGKTICVRCYNKLKNYCEACMRSTNKKIYKTTDGSKVCKDCKELLHSHGGANKAATGRWLRQP